MQIKYADIQDSDVYMQHKYADMQKVCNQLRIKQKNQTSPKLDFQHAICYLFKLQFIQIDM